MRRQPFRRAAIVITSPHWAVTVSPVQSHMTMLSAGSASSISARISNSPSVVMSGAPLMVKARPQSFMSRFNGWYSEGSAACIL